MDLKEGIQKLKELIKFSEAQSIKLAEVALKDGSVLIIEGEVPEVGAVANVKAEDGLLPAPNGEHIAEDGTIIVVLDGLVSEIILPDAAPEAPAEGDVEMKKMIMAMNAKFELRLKDIESKFKSLNGELAVANTKLKAQSKVQSETFSIVEKIAALPAVKSIKDVAPIEAVPNKFSAIAEGIKKLKDNK